ncbi:hypothetical protein [Saccharicrinis fermentans]|uniref:Uncharacterized protein n=1 Tax=Saccharicrinis fermentans DSM 9555 = JCM 21142 TaxID=869213 RepID=W7Y144_9BACT|nr:hypothetical protein [Saccharicrinis fermentans]GAF04635.1 hypothetical protein JCM21142_93347 [Saccharicrinis fermentans DSM 9555 = JCM 21142]
MTQEELIPILSDTIDSKLFRMVKMAENAGFGFDKIESNWQDYNQMAPEYDLAFDSTIVKLTLSADKVSFEKTEYGIGSDKNDKEFGLGSA